MLQQLWEREGNHAGEERVPTQEALHRLGGVHYLLFHADMLALPLLLAVVVLNVHHILRGCLQSKGSRLQGASSTRGGGCLAECGTFTFVPYMSRIPSV